MLELSNEAETMLVDYDGVLKPYTQAQSKMLFEDLREWRLNQAAILEIPAYCVLDDKTLHHIANVLPSDTNMLWLVPGLSDVKIDAYGKDIVDIVNAFFAKFHVNKVLYGRFSLTITNKVKPILGYLGLLDYFSHNL